jgi:sulfate adenylyltransferase
MPKSTRSGQTPGFCVWFTGLSGAGKTTLAEALQTWYERQGRSVTVLDGDAVRQYLSKGLGFSREDRDTNVARVGYLASQIVYQGGIVVCALVSPYRQTRTTIRNMFPEDNFLEVYVATPLVVCESRDVKGLYKKARAGEIQNFTGINDPYEPPLNPEITVDTTEMSVTESLQVICEEIVRRGLAP